MCFAGFSINICFFFYKLKLDEHVPYGKFGCFPPWFYDEVLVLIASVPGHVLLLLISHSLEISILNHDYQ